MGVPNMRKIVRVGCLTVVLAGGCVSSGTYNAKMAEAEQLRADAGKLQAQLAQVTRQRDELQAQYAAALARVASLEARLDDTVALAGQLKGRLEQLGQNVDRLTTERGQMAAGLQEAKARLEELRRQKAAADARAAMFRGLVQRLRSMIDTGQLKVSIRDGRMLIALSDEVLFDSGKTTIKPQGQEALAQVAQVLGTLSDRHFLVAGHTDNVPIRFSGYKSNWELSAARAIAVTQFLISKGMRPDVLAAAGYGEFDPVGANDSAEQRAQNRRIEIVLQPNLSDLPSLDGIDARQGQRAP